MDFTVTFSHIYIITLNYPPNSPLALSPSFAESLPSNSPSFCFYVKYIPLIPFPFPLLVFEKKGSKWNLMLNILNVLTILFTIPKWVFVDIIICLFSIFPLKKKYMLCGGYVSCPPPPHTCPRGLINIWWINKTSGVHSCLQKAHPPFFHQFDLLHQVNNIAVGIEKKSSLYSRHLFIASVSAEAQTRVTWFCI